MKKTMITVIVCAVLLSCSSDNSGSSPNVAGHYLMTTFNIDEAVDLNGDGTASRNLVTEFECYENSFITLNANNTFTALSTEIAITSHGGVSLLDCHANPQATGTWAKSGNKIIMTHTFEGDTETLEYTLSGNQLNLSIPTASGIGMADGVPVYTTSDIEVVLTKQ